MSANIERKFRCADLAAARRRALAHGAEPRAVEEQLDTYFAVDRGRLKLRQVTGQPALLIAYTRPDATTARTCQYTLVPAPEPELLREALAACLEIRGEVRKIREILLWRNVRIHLDRVDHLGPFVEFEAVLDAGETAAEGHARVAELTVALGLAEDDAVAGSYSDLLGL